VREGAEVTRLAWETAIGCQNWARQQCALHTAALVAPQEPIDTAHLAVLLSIGPFITRPSAGASRGRALGAADDLDRTNAREAQSRITGRRAESVCGCPGVGK
jgi:hypothetical protein